MKYIKAFLVESELEDLRRDLMGLGYERWEVSVNGTISIRKEVDRWMSYEVWAKGVGDTKESAMRYALQAIYECVEEGEVIEEVKSEWKGEMVNINFKFSKATQSLKNIFPPDEIGGEVEWEFSTSTELESYGKALPEFNGEFYIVDGKIYKR